MVHIKNLLLAQKNIYRATFDENLLNIPYEWNDQYRYAVRISFFWNV